MPEYAFEKGPLKFITGGKYPHCHSLLVEAGQGLIIDPAADEAALAQVAAAGKVGVVLNTHAHEDHFLYNRLFPEARLWAGRLEARFFSSIDGLAELFGSPEDDDGEFRRGLEGFITGEVGFTPRPPDRLLEDGEEIDLGETRLRVIHTPGHTPGHVSLFFPEEEVLFLADYDLVRAGPYYGDALSSLEDTIASLEKLMRVPAKTYLTAHGRLGVHPGDPGLIRRYLAVIDQREERVLDHLRPGPLGLDQVTALGIIYGGKTLDTAWDLSQSERMMMSRHLERLVAQGRVRREGGLFYAV